MKGYIYKIKNIQNGKFYIGSTIEFEKRKTRHLKDLRKGTHHNIFLLRAFEKYGEESFEFSFKEVKVENKKDLQLLEERYIIFCWNSGKLYNVSKMGSGGDLISYHPKRCEIIKKTSESLKKYYSNLNDEERIVLRKKMTGELNPNYGNKWSDAQRKKASIMQKEKVKNGTCPLLKFHGKSLVESYGEAKALKIKEKISKYASKRTGEKNTFFGKHHTEETKRKLAEINRGRVNESTRKKVLYQGIVYATANECAKALNLKYNTVCYRARNKIYGFSYIEEKEKDKYN